MKNLRIFLAIFCITLPTITLCIDPQEILNELQGKASDDAALDYVNKIINDARKNPEQRATKRAFENNENITATLIEKKFFKTAAKVTSFITAKTDNLGFLESVLLKYFINLASNEQLTFDEFINAFDPLSMINAKYTQEYHSNMSNKNRSISGNALHWFSRFPQIIFAKKSITSETCAAWKKIIETWLPKIINKKLANEGDHFGMPPVYTAHFLWWQLGNIYQAESEQIQSLRDTTNYLAQQITNIAPGAKNTPKPIDGFYDQNEIAMLTKTCIHNQCPIADFVETLEQNDQFKMPEKKQKNKKESVVERLSLSLKAIGSRL